MRIFTISGLGVHNRGAERRVKLPRSVRRVTSRSKNVESVESITYNFFNAESCRGQKCQKLMLTSHHQHLFSRSAYNLILCKRATGFTCASLAHARRIHVAQGTGSDVAFKVLFFGRDEFSCIVFEQLFAARGRFRAFWFFTCVEMTSCIQRRRLGGHTYRYSP